MLSLDPACIRKGVPDTQPDRPFLAEPHPQLVDLPAADVPQCVLPQKQLSSQWKLTSQGDICSQDATMTGPSQ